MAKETFDVKVVLASEERIIRVQTSDEQEADKVFTVYSGSETLGVLRRLQNNGWEWAEGTRSPEDANVIGNEIDAQATN